MHSSRIVIVIHTRYILCVLHNLPINYIIQFTLAYFVAFHNKIPLHRTFLYVFRGYSLFCCSVDVVVLVVVFVDFFPYT